MSLREILRKVFLCIALGGHSVLGVGMSQEKIEELLYAMHRTRLEVTVSDDDETNEASAQLAEEVAVKSRKNLGRNYR